MKPPRLTTILQQIEACNYAFDLAKDFHGACPCADFKLEDSDGQVSAHSRCWRVSESDQDLYVWGDHPGIDAIAKALKKVLDETEWYSTYTIRMEEFK